VSVFATPALSRSALARPPSTGVTRLRILVSRGAASPPHRSLSADPGGRLALKMRDGRRKAAQCCDAINTIAHCPCLPRQAIVYSEFRRMHHRRRDGAVVELDVTAV